MTALQENSELHLRRARQFQIAIAVGAAIVTLALWAVVVTSVRFAHESAFERARSNAANMSAAFTEEMSHRLDDISGAMDILSNRMRDDGASFDIQAWASDIPLMAVGTIQGVVIGPDGKLVSTTLDPHAPPMDLSDREHFRVHVDGSYKGLFISEPVIGRVSKQSTIQISKRVEAADGRFLGVLVFSLPASSLTTLHRSVNLGEQGIMVLEGMDGGIRARFSRSHPDGTVPPGLKGPVGARANITDDDAHGDAVLTGVVDHVTRLCSYRRVPHYPLVVTVGLDLEEALAPSTTHALILISFACAGTLILVGLAAWLVREIGKRAERELEAAKERALLRDAVESVSEGFVIYDREDRLIVLNEPYASLYGAPTSANTTFEELVRQGLAEGRYLDAIGREEEWLLDRLRRHREGKDSLEQSMSNGRSVLATDRRMRSGGIVGLRIDITALKQVQAALRESEERLTQSQQHLALAQGVSEVGSLLRNLKTGTVEWSDELYRILGFEPRSIAPSLENLMERVHPDDRAAVMVDRDSVLRGGTQKMPDYRIVRLDGAVRILQRGQRLFVGEDGQPTHFLVVFRDITDIREAETKRRDLELQLHHSQKLEALGTLAGGIAHDLNNTLVPIITMAKLNLQHTTPGSSEHEDLQLIYRGGLRARDLVTKVLAFSRKEVADRRLFRIDEVLHEAVAMLRPTIPATIELELGIAPVPAILGDATQFHQILVNLVTNAVHAIGMRHGTIAISLRQISDTASAKPGSIEISVTDTGCGMDAATQRRIFDPFFTTKPVGEGTGLGLSVVHGIVSNHGGTIEVESELGRGTRFVINLPSSAQPEETIQIDERNVA
jgi:signal transduction histidine kinase